MPPRPLEVLLVEDQPGDARLVELALAGEPAGEFVLRRAARISEALALLGQRHADVILLDLGLPDSQGFEGLRTIRDADPRTAVVVLSGTEDPDLVGKAVGEGAEEYEVKGLYPRGYLGGVVRAAVVLRRSRARLADPRPLRREELSELDTLSEAIAVVESRQIRVANRTCRRLFDWTEGVPIDLPSLMSEAATRAERTLGGPAIGPGGAFAWGEGMVPRADGRKTSVRYLAETWPVPSGRRLLVRLRPRSATGTGSGSGGDPAWVAPTVGAGLGPASPLPNSTNPGAVLDANAWLALREIAGTEPTFVPQLLETFRTYGAELVTALAVADARGDVDGVQRAAHSLKSTVAQVGATRLAEISRDLENACRAGQADRARDLVPQVEPEFRRVLEALRNPPVA